MELSLEGLVPLVSPSPCSSTTNWSKLFLRWTTRWCARSSTFNRCWFLKFLVVWIVIYDTNGRINRCRFFDLLLFLCESRLNCRSARCVSTCDYLLLGLNDAGRAFSVKDVEVGRPFYNRFRSDRN